MPKQKSKEREKKERSMAKFKFKKIAAIAMSAVLAVTSAPNLSLDLLQQLKQQRAVHLVQILSVN